MSSGIRKVGVIGMGLMGSGIAQVAATQKFTVFAMDVAPQLVAKGMSRIRDSLRRLVKSHQQSNGKSGITAAQMEETLNHLQTSTDRGALLDTDVLIEAIVENEVAKKELVGALSQLGFKGLFVSNTSSISITRLASAYAVPEKFMGMHFMNPVAVQPGCELIRGLLTSEDTFRSILEFCRDLGKEPILAEDKAGFGINRMFVPFLNEAVKVIEEGVMSCEDADKTTLCLGHRMGPITTLDYVGLDTTLAIGEVLARELGPSYRPPDLLAKLVAAGFYGVKNDGGFYLWEKGQKLGVNPAVQRYRRK